MFAKNEVTALIDTGSSISLLSEHLFHKFKNELTYKHLSSNVSLKTVNSTVQFSACIKTSFKIHHKFFSHTFYIVDIPPSSPFQILLGFDFLQQNQIVIDTAKCILKLNDLSIPIIGMCNDLENMHLRTHSHNVNNPFPVKLAQKVILEPHEEKLIDVNCRDIVQNNYLFESNYNSPHVIMFDAIIEIKQDCKNNKKKSNSKSNFTFQVHILNTSNKVIHLNKGTKIGQLAELDHIIEQNESVKDCDIGNDSIQQFTAYIQASKEILNLRKADLLPSDFDLSHLPTEQAGVLQKILLDNFAAFSKSLKNLGHTDRLVPDIKFINAFSIKTLPFPIPHALTQKEKP